MIKKISSAKKPASHTESKSCFPKCKITIAAIVLVVIGVAGTVFYVKNRNADSKNAAGIQPNASGIDQGKSVKNVGDVEEVIAKWVAANPEAIIQSVAAMQQKAMKEYEDKMKEKRKNSPDEIKKILSDKSSPSRTPAGYTATVIEFFDYNCGYCKKAQNSVEELIKTDPKVRIVYKEFPILGPDSVDLASVALAVHLTDPKAYPKFHDVLMKSTVRSKADALKLLKTIGVNQKKVEQTLASKRSKIESIIAKNKEAAEAMGITGTPGFIIGEELVPGMVDSATMKQKVDAYRAAKKS